MDADPLAILHERVARDLTINGLEERCAELTGCLRRLASKLEAVTSHPDYKAVWGLAFTHGLVYRGPTFASELSAALDMIATLPPSPTAPEPAPAS